LPRFARPPKKQRIIAKVMENPESGIERGCRLDLKAHSGRAIVDMSDGGWESAPGLASMFLACTCRAEAGLGARNESAALYCAYLTVQPYGFVRAVVIFFSAISSDRALST